MSKSSHAIVLEKVTFYLPRELRVKLEHTRIDQRATVCSIMTDLVEGYVKKPFAPVTPDRRKTRFKNKKGA